MRNIKFRGQRKTDKSWEFGSLYVNEKGETFIDKKEWKREPVAPETVGQFTGLFDKFGKEIYEGDILQTIMKLENIKVYWKILWGKSNKSNENIEAWCAKTSRGIYYLDESLQKQGEIIGNIYENPHLTNITGTQTS